MAVEQPPSRLEAALNYAVDVRRSLEENKTHRERTPRARGTGWRTRITDLKETLKGPKK